MLRFIDGFAHYSIGQILRKWTSTSGGSIGTGRFTGTKAYDTGNNNFVGLSRTIDQQSTWIIGFAFNLSRINSNRILRLIDVSTVQLVLMINSDNTLTIRRGDTGGTVLGTTSATIATSTWYYIELKVTIHTSTGSCDLRINGSSALSVSGINTSASGNNQANVINFFGTSGDNCANGLVTDIYICDGTSNGSSNPNNDFLGDVKVETLFPDGAGNHTDFTKGGTTPAATNWQGVNNNPSDDDVSYNYSLTTNQIDSYTFTDLSSTPVSIFGIQSNITVRKDNSGPRAETPLIRISSTDYLLSSYSPGTSYSINSQIKELSPATGVPWTATEINNAEYGLKLTT